MLQRRLFARRRVSRFDIPPVVRHVSALEETGCFCFPNAFKDTDSNNYARMGKALIIAEKPSVASDIARALSGFKKEQDYFESEQYVLSSAVGHLLEITAPEEYEA